MDKRKKILETLKKLLVHEQSARTIGSLDEAYAFAVKIAELKRQFRVEDHEVEPTVIDAMDFRDFGVTLVTRYTGKLGEVPWQAVLFQILGAAQACEVIFVPSTGNFFVAGATLDRAVVIALSDIIVEVVERLQDKAWQDYFPPSAVSRFEENGFKESYRCGFLQALDDRLREEARANTDEAALILISRAVTKLHAFLARTGQAGVSGSMEVNMQVKHGGAATQGYEDGMRQDLSVNSLSASAQQPKKEIAQ